MTTIQYANWVRVKLNSDPKCPTEKPHHYERQLSYRCLSYTATPSGMAYQSCFSLTQICAVGLMMLVSDKFEGLSLIFSGSSGLK